MGNTVFDLKEAVSWVKKEEAEALTKELLADGIAPMIVLEQGVMAGLSELGDRFEAKKAIVLDLVKGGVTAKTCIPLIQAAFPEGEAGADAGKKVVLGTMLSQHNIGKNLVSTLLSISGYEVFDIGEKREPWDFYEKAEEVGADLIAVSVVFGPAMQKFGDLIELLKELKVREKYPVIVGGAVTHEKWASEMGADGWGKQAKDAVSLTEELTL